jgi:chemotaxis signal transduction protein
VELATFFVGGRRLAFEKEHVLEAVPCESITSKFPGSAEYLEGALEYRRRIVPVINMRVVCGHQKIPFDIYTQIIVVALPGGECIGCLVDDLDAVPEYDSEIVQPIPSTVAGDAGYVKSLVRSEASGPGMEMTLVLDPELVLKSARAGAHPNGAAIPGAARRQRQANAWQARIEPALTIVKAAPAKRLVAMDESQSIAL